MNKIKKRFLLMPLILMLSACGKNEVAVKKSSGSESPDIAVSDDKPDNEITVIGQTDGEQDMPEDADNTGSDQKNSETAVIAVYVCGAVKKEGVYRLPEGSIVDDALRLAGGYSEDACHGYINLAQQLSDGMRLYFPSKQEMEEAIVSGGMDIDAVGEENSPYSKDDIGSSGMVNINTADKDELMTLPGIGETRAEAIIRYRNAHGEFKSIDDIKNITGIKEGIFEKIRSLITV